MPTNLSKIIWIVSRYTLLVLLIQCLSCIMLLAHDTSAQGTENIYLSVNWKNAGLRQVLSDLEQNTQFDFSYKDSEVANLGNISLKAHNKSLKEILIFLSKEKKLKFLRLNDVISVSRIPSGSKQPVVEELDLDLDREISGKVTDQNGLPLPGANVLVSGTTLGTTTDVDGNYRLTVPDDAVMLVFSFIGYATEEVEIAGRSVVDMVMLPDIQSLEGVEVVSTGYYEVKQRLNPGNIAKVDAKVIERQPVVNPLEALQGQVAGVFIEQTSGLPGAPININIRGLNSLNNGQSLLDAEGNTVSLPNSNLPFFVIDGVPYTSNSLNAETFLLGDGNPLAAFRPNDIESIEVLKDADATAIYGSRGANGVILITTKKGKEGKTKLDLDFSRGIGEVPRKVDLLNTSQYLAMRREAWQNDQFIPSDADDTLANSDLLLWSENRNADWQEELAGGKADQTNASISISGGSSQTKFLFRGSFFRQTNVYNYDNSVFESASGHLNLNHTSRDNRFNINSSVTYTANANDQIGINYMSEALVLAPNAPQLFDENGQINFSDNFDNPLAELEQQYENKTRVLVANISFRYELLPGLDFKSAIGYTNSNVDETNIIPLASFIPAERDNRTGRSSVASGNEETWIIEPQLAYTKELGKSVLSTVIGTTLQGSSREQKMILGTGYESDLLIKDIGQAPNVSVQNNFFSEFRYIGVYARVNYAYDEKYVLNLTGRHDGSSRFGSDKQFGSFGALGAAWLFSEESFIADHLSFLSFGKFRASYGVTGNDQIGDYAFLDTYAAPDVFINSYLGTPGLIAVRAANPGFSWEINRKLEFGLELGFLKNRFNLSTSYFRNRSDNQLIGRPLSSVTGFSITQFNLPALVENRGLEIELNTTNINTGNFMWTSSLNFTRARNELVEFPDIEQFAPFDNRYIVGRSTFGSKQFKSLGVDPLTGIYSLADLDGNGQVSIADRQDFVEIFQDYFGGLSNNFSWKGFQFDVFLRFVKQNGRDFSTDFLSPGQVFEGRGGNQPDRMLSSQWQEPGNVTNIQRFTQTNTAAINNRRRHNVSNATVVDASFIRLQNVALSYSLPGTFIDKLKLSRAVVHINCQNLHTWTPYDGLDPETQGIALPPLRMVTTGVRLTF